MARLAVLINPLVLEIYPTVPKPITVLVRFVVVRAPIIFVAWMEETNSCCALIESMVALPAAT